MKPRVCVIGAGASGLCAAKHLLAVGITPCILERAATMGGTWVYTENVGYDHHGLPVHTSMYKSLRTNLPKEIMGFPDFPIPESSKSYLPAKEMMEFLKSYSDTHNVTRHIKFNHYAKLIKPRGDIWDIDYVNLITNEEVHEEFDAVMICNGHYNTPFVPKIKGMDTFKGDVMHSHDYRVPEVFEGKRVLVMGAGPSGMDIAFEITSVTKKVILSHHLKEKPKSKFPNNLEQKPDLEKLRGNTAIFTDGSEEEIDVLFFCTGYLYNFPFLDKSCGITVEENYVQPLYKHLVNIEHPTMCLVGVPYYVCAFSMFDLQVRYFVNALEGHFKIPSKEKMYEACKTEFDDRMNRGYTKRQAHMMGPDQENYYKSLADEAATTSLPSVLTMIRDESSMRFLHNIQNYRNDVYKIIDDKTYAVISNGQTEIISCP